MKYRIERGIEVEPLPEAEAFAGGGPSSKPLSEWFGPFGSIPQAREAAQEIRCPSPESYEALPRHRILGFVRLCLHDPGGPGNGTVIETIDSHELVRT